MAEGEKEKRQHTHNHRHRTQIHSHTDATTNACLLPPILNKLMNSARQLRRQRQRRHQRHREEENHSSVLFFTSTWAYVSVHMWLRFLQLTNCTRTHTDTHG